jgi:hypothetical protein
MSQSKRDLPRFEEGQNATKNIRRYSTGITEVEIEQDGSGMGAQPNGSYFSARARETI